MDWEIRRLQSDEDLLAYARVQLSAYPAATGPAENLLPRIRLIVDHDDTSHLWGVFSGERLLGCMRMLDFQLNYCGRFIPAGGIGSVAVDFTEKKQGVAKAIIQFFIDHYRQQGAHLTLLYPFRPDFYHRMGYGYAPKMQQYCFTPDSLPAGDRRHGVQLLTEADLGDLREFSERYAASHHGFCRRSEFELQGLIRNHAANRTLVGWRQQGQLMGYLAYGFRKEKNFVQNSLLIREWLWSGQPAFQAFCSFLHGQADQVYRIVLNTIDDSFHYALHDVRNGSDNILPSVYHESNLAGVGLMYRLAGLREFLQATDYRTYHRESLDLRLQVTDSFCPANAGTYCLRFQDGQLSVWDDLPTGTDLAVDIADLSALLLGAVDLASLYRLGRVQLDQQQLPQLNRLFQLDQRPECITAF